MTRSLRLLRNRWPAALLATAIGHCSWAAPQPPPCLAYAGGVEMEYGPHCLEGGSATLTAEPLGNAEVPAGFTTLFFLSRTNGMILEQMGTAPSFTVTTADTWRIHTLVYDPATLDLSDVVFGSTYAYQLQNILVQGGGSVCASLDMSGGGAKTTECDEPCTAYAGGVEMEYGPHCLVDGSATLSADPLGNAQVPAGFTTLYFLSRTNGMILEQVSTVPSFTVTTADTWRIHTLVYDPATLDLSGVVFGTTYAYMLQELLIQGGGSICASLDMSGGGAKTVECQEACTADAGTISASNPDLCLTDGAAQLIATTDGNATVPAGYNLIHVLTTGPNLVIVATAADPSFTVNMTGAFTIHTLVYDPATLDLSGIVPGVTTGGDVAALLLQGGGSICASLDVPGAQFQVADCTPVCDAWAGTVTAAENEVCRVEGIAHLEAIPNGDVVVPDGYSVAYILARANGVIENVEPNSDFEWPLLGEYVVHTLVYDPFTLNPFTVSLGSTNLSFLLEQLIQGGGTLCGSLDLEGAAFTVVDCAPPCTAGLDADTTVCFTDAPFNLFDLLGPDVCPGGVWTNQFTGQFDPASDPSGIYTYTAVLSNGLTDIAFITVDVIECPGPCDADAGPDASTVLCTNDAALDLSTLIGGDVGGFWTDPNGQAFSGVFVPAIGEAGTYTYVVGASGPCSGDTALVDVAVNVAANAGSDGSVTLCASGPAVNLFNQLNGNPQIGGTWYGPDASATSGVLAPATGDTGTYTYVVQGTAPCANDTATVTVVINTAPDAGFSAQVVLCSSDAPLVCFGALGGSPDAGGTWTGPNGAPFSGTFDPATDPAGLYIYTVPGEAPCLGAQATLAIIVQDCCDAGADADTTLCFTDAPFSMFAALGGTPCPGGTWTDPLNQPHADTFIPGIDASGVYIYTVVNNDGSIDQSTLTIDVIECPNNCEADAGTLTNEDPEVCLQNGTAILASTSNGDASIPAGYISAFLLSSGPELTLLAVESSPFFVVDAQGLYTIHTVVYDFTTWDLSAIDWGTTTVGDVSALFIQGGGNVCASIDVQGAQFFVSDCTPICFGNAPDAGIGGDIIRCSVDPPTDLFDLLQGTPQPGGSWTAPDGQPFNGVFDPASDPDGVYVYTVFDLPDCPPDTTQLNISVVDCPELLAQLTAWPNPTTDVTRITAPNMLRQGATIIITDAMGRIMRLPLVVAGRTITVDAANAPTGTYVLRVLDGGAPHIARFSVNGR